MNDERDELWNLLGQTRQTKISPFFARNVLRAVRVEQQERRGFWSPLLHAWRVAIPVGAAAVVIGFSSVALFHKPQAPHNPLTAQIVRNPDYDVINHLDELVASEEDALWTEPSVD